MLLNVGVVFDFWFLNIRMEREKWGGGVRFEARIETIQVEGKGAE